MIETRTEARRGCGYRKLGGLYLVSGALAAPCGKLPIPLTVCSCCGEGFKPLRSWRWIKPRALFQPELCDLGRRTRAATDAPNFCTYCPAGEGMPETAGLLWVGGAFYKTPADFTAEAAAMGISRRISAVPKGLVKDGQLVPTWVFLAHREAVEPGPLDVDCKTCFDVAAFEAAGKPGDWKDVPPEICPEHGGRRAGIFSIFRPTALEKIVDDSCTDEEAEALRKRGITPVKVVPVDDDGRTPDLARSATSNGQELDPDDDERNHAG